MGNLSYCYSKRLKNNVIHDSNNIEVAEAMSNDFKEKCDEIGLTFFDISFFTIYRF